MLRRPWPLPHSTSRDFLEGNDPEPIRSCECSGPVGNQSKMGNEEWCRGTELNCRHQPFQGCALPTELPRHGSGQEERGTVTGSSEKNQAAWSVWFIRLIWSIWFISFNQTHETDRIDQMNKIGCGGAGTILLFLTGALEFKIEGIALTAA